MEPGKPNFIYCEKCYIEKFTKGSCPACFRPVMSKTDPYITHNKSSWHAACFKCFKCRIDVSSKPLVDLRGRPCCEECLMAQAGSAAEESNSSPNLKEDVPNTNSPPLDDRSMTSSPPYTSQQNPSSSSGVDNTTDRSERSPVNLSPLDLHMDKSLPPSNSPLSAQSTASPSSLASYRSTPTSGYTSGTSSAYSSLGRKRADSVVLPSAISAANLLRADHSGSAANSPVLQYRRPSSALSIHSYTSSRPNSPSLNSRQDQENEGTFKSHDYPETIDQDQDPNMNENTSESTLYGLRHARSRHSLGSEDLGPNIARALQQRSDADNGSRSSSRANSRSSSRPVRNRSRSVASPSTTAASVRARTQAYINMAQTNTTSTTSSPPRSSSQLFNANRGSAIFSNLPPKQQPSAAATAIANGSYEKESKESAPMPSGAEPNRSISNTSPSFRRNGHGHQRSNSAGDAIVFPVVNVTDAPWSPSVQRAATIPEGHCHKCLEKVTENGVRLQNGDRYHIGCFLCYGCKQVFTESEFHVVLGRPYHPKCVSMAGPTSSMGVVTKCQQCHKVISNKSIRFSGMNYHPQCFTCAHCSKVLTSTSRFFEVDGRVECEQCCDERDAVRLPPKIVPVPRATDHFPLPVMVPSNPGMVAGGQGNLSRSGSGAGSATPLNESSSPLRASGSPSYDQLTFGDQIGSGASSPLAQRATPPPLTSFFGTRTRPLPKFGGTLNCPRCHQPVGLMDQTPGPNNEKWHKKCLNCKECKKVLDSSALTRGEGEAYCRGCFNKTRTRV
ncbi:hypothetical protein BCR41DRAFT_1292 [Lobosporangium transversale]|uniref:LIM zinc-binding domain-containing protein n=1 Tax=Lobosporangium transversale TaxID=64571 RepID=A0A1Y2H6H0_9FUNG|nr:hypothetical protein BCR41DRAFT_1292 [Lobosporangium transversale]ORZ28652.1 hypothetical protein BCR41DRAFT_1292 [Lobosporangium transversale]|eukprot:XP_021886325.1 hypothetical protein BCR41DRAFT_1292 [Lobosporangium transversale]